MTTASAVSAQVRPVDLERNVKAFGSDGRRRRTMYSQGTARDMARLKSVIAVWDRRGKKILTIHFYESSGIPLKSRLKAGTRYSYLEPIGDRRVWKQKPLPYRAMDLATGCVETPAVLDAHIRAIFQAVQRSIIATDVSRVTVRKPIVRLAPVISIDAARTKMSEKAPTPRRAEVIELQKAA